MRKKVFFNSVIFALLLTGCGDGEKPTFRKKRTVEKQHSFLNLQRIFSPLEKEISFPIWFDSTIVEKKGIKQIIRNIYPLNETDSTSAYPKEKWVYSFDEKGKINQVEIAHYYENTKTDEVSIFYPKGTDENGFSSANIQQKEGKIVNTLQQHNKKNYGEKFLVYENKSSGDYLFYVIDPKYRGVVAIDEALSPTVQDIVGIGTPLEIKERFILKNKVEQYDKIVFKYDKTHVEKMQFDQQPFTTKRFIQYAEDGHCSGFVDSTFSGAKFLSCVNTSLQTQKDNLPVRVVHSSELNKGDAKNFRLEVFDYQFRKK